MTSQELPFDRAKAGRDLGMLRAERHAGEEWNDYCDDFIYVYCRIYRELFCDDLWTAGLEVPAQPKALGPRISAAGRADWIRKSGEYRPSVRSHLQVKPVWESLIYGWPS